MISNHTEATAADAAQGAITALVIEDDADVSDLVERCLTDIGYRVLTARDAASALQYCDDETVDVAVVDLMLPDANGIALVRQLSQQLGIPVLVLSGLGETSHKIEGLDAGADDYLAKPFEPEELVARVMAVLRARQQAAVRHLAPGNRVRFDEWIIDFTRRTVTNVSGEQIDLSDSEFKLLKALAERPNEVLTREQILNLTHVEHGPATERSVDIQVTRLRKKIESDPSRPRFIRTVRNAGYMLVAREIIPESQNGAA